MSEAKANRKPGWWYPYIFPAAFVPVLLVNGFFAYSAVHSFTGSEKDAYERGLVYNEELARAKAQRELGWAVKTDLASNGVGHDQKLLVEIDARDGKPVEGLSVSVDFVRPTKEGFDTKTALKADGMGRYVGTATVALPGQWEMRITASKDGADYKESRRVFIR